MQLNGKTILLTGGTDGIGRALAVQLKAKGAKVIVTGRTAERIAETQAAGFETIMAELSSQSGVEAVLAAIQGRDINVLINNAGAGSDHDFREATPDLTDNDRCIALNLNTPIHLISRFDGRIKGATRGDDCQCHIGSRHCPARWWTDLLRDQGRPAELYTRVACTIEEIRKFMCWRCCRRWSIQR